MNMLPAEWYSQINVLEILKPSLCVCSVANLTPEAIRSELPDAKGVVFDLHRTLTDHAGNNVPEMFLASLRALLAADLEIGIMSVSANTVRAARTHQIARDIGSLICRDKDNGHYKVATITSMDMAERSGKKRGNGKPFRPIFMAIATEMGIEPEKLFYVGDQILRDVVGGNRHFGGSALVSPYGIGDNKNVRRFQRPLEAGLRPLIGLPYHPEDFGRIRSS
jgi:predicted HAD superfamily phosphohydrolase YqeG